MKYEMEELVPIAGKLAERYTVYESTSITYEKARQYMEAVLYCINEMEQSGDGFMLQMEKIPAQRAYENGMLLVEEKTKKALKLYHDILPDFMYYDNDCLYDTFVNGLPEFFKWYDIRFEPQKTILTLDYPVLRDLSGYTGIDKIYEFIRCISLEQKFLTRFPKDYVISILSDYNTEYKEMIDNICEIVLKSMIEHIIAGKPLTDSRLENVDYQHIREVFLQTGLSDLNGQIKKAVEAFVEKYCENNEEVTQYLSGAVNGITVRLKNSLKS